MAAVYTGDGSRRDGSRLVAPRGAALLGAAVAATSSTVTGGQEGDRPTERESMSTSRPGGVIEELKTRFEV
jgi:hypothetical protein